MSEKPPEPDLAAGASQQRDLDHLRDVVGALEFLLADAERMTPGELRTAVAAVLTVLRAAYYGILERDSGKGPGDNG
jgi:hypothetical protein